VRELYTVQEMKEGKTSYGCLPGLIKKEYSPGYAGA
jgi:hypothetical protein